MNQVRVLFVDDDPLVLWALEKTMLHAKLPWHCEFTTRADEALDKIQSSRWDLLVTDIEMPVMDGVTLCDRAQAAWPGLRCVAVSGAYHEGKTDPKLRRFSALVDKPFSSQKLIAILEYALHQQRSRE